MPRSTLATGADIFLRQKPVRKSSSAIFATLAAACFALGGCQTTSGPGDQDPVSRFLTRLSDVASGRQEERLERLESELSRLKSENADLEEKLDQYNEELAALKKLYGSKFASLMAKDRQLKRARKQKALESMRQAKLTARLEQWQSRYDELIQRASDKGYTENQTDMRQMEDLLQEAEVLRMEISEIAGK